jgi:hypothetical protein
VVKVLCIRHHCLQNKQADSCHVIRNTIKTIDGPAFPSLWHKQDGRQEGRVCQLPERDT